MLKDDSERALATKNGRITEDLKLHTIPLAPLVAGNVVQVQNQRGKDPLRWDKSGIVVENLDNQQYTVKMDGSGRVTLRNRKFLRKIEPFIPRNITVEKLLDDQKVDDKEGGEAKVTENFTEEQVVDETVDDEVRRSTRVRHTPDRDEAD